MTDEQPQEIDTGDPPISEPARAVTQGAPEDRAKHLEFILGIIARLANNSFLMKGWGITTAGAVFTFAAQRQSWTLALIGFIPTSAFYWLDAYYLRQERLFRCLYEAVRKGEVESFLINHKPYQNDSSNSWRCILGSLPLKVFYGSIAGAGIVITLTLLLFGNPTNAGSATTTRIPPDSTTSPSNPAPTTNSPTQGDTTPAPRPPSTLDPGEDGRETPPVTPPLPTSG